MSGRARRRRVLGAPFVAGASGWAGRRAEDVPGRPGAWTERGRPTRPDRRSPSTATITNGGTEPLTNVMLEISAPGLDLTFERRGAECTRETEGLFCEFARLDGGESREVTASAMARRVGLDQNSRAVPLQRALARDRHRSKRIAAEDRRALLHAEPLRDARPRERRTYLRDALCRPALRSSRSGRDPSSGKGKDRVAAGAGPDVIYARDGDRDVIACGLGRDLVIADRKDKVARDCERVRRH